MTITWNWNWSCDDAPPPLASSATTICVSCNIAISVRVGSPGDNGDLTQTIAPTSNAIAENVASVAQQASQSLPSPPSPPAVPTPPLPSPLPALPHVPSMPAIPAAAIAPVAALAAPALVQAAAQNPPAAALEPIPPQALPVAALAPFVPAFGAEAVESDHLVRGGYPTTSSTRSRTIRRTRGGPEQPVRAVSLPITTSLPLVRTALPSSISGSTTNVHRDGAEKASAKRRGRSASSPRRQPQPPKRQPVSPSPFTLGAGSAPGGGGASAVSVAGVTLGFALFLLAAFLIEPRARGAFGGARPHPPG